MVFEQAVHAPDGQDATERHEVTAVDPADLFDLLASRMAGRRAELWVDDAQLYVVEGRPEGFWTVAPPARDRNRG